ncbi:MAG: hypothetical protein QM831_07290 [Kofleriaceae bacterium]
MTTYCCVQCRLLQPPSTTCADCGAHMVAPVELVRELLAYRDMKMTRGRDWGFATAGLAGAAILWPVVTPFALACALIAARVSSRGKRIAAIDPPVIKSGASATTIYGTARKFRSTVTSIVDDSEVLAEAITIRPKRSPMVLLRRIMVAPFLIDPVDGGAPVLITGAVHVRGMVQSNHEWVRRGHPLLAKLGVPGDLYIQGPLDAQAIVEAGPVLSITGTLGEEAVPELAFHRDGGLVSVMRGTHGAPVIVEDRRLIGAIVRY